MLLLLTRSTSGGRGETLGDGGSGSCSCDVEGSLNEGPAWVSVGDESLSSALSSCRALATLFDKIFRHAGREKAKLSNAKLICCEYFGR